MKDFLGFGALNTPLQTTTDSISKYYGELDADGELHGRGISIRNDGRIWIGYFEDGWLSTGNYINIYNGDRFRVVLNDG